MNFKSLQDEFSNHSLTFPVQHLKFVLYPQIVDINMLSQSCGMVSNWEGEGISGLAVDQCLVRKAASNIDCLNCLL